MSSPESNKPQWAGYVCPDCRAVFRLPMHHVGRGTVCPVCIRLLRIPQPGEATPVLVMPTPRGLGIARAADTQPD